MHIFKCVCLSQYCNILSTHTERFFMQSDTVCNATINTSDRNDIPFCNTCTLFSSWMANVIPGCWDITNNTFCYQIAWKYLYFVWRERTSITKKKKISSCSWWLECLVHTVGVTDMVSEQMLPKRFYLRMDSGEMPLSCARGIIRNTGCQMSVGVASHWCDQPHCEGCYGSLRMEWLRTNGVCFPAHGAGMVKGALIECTERGFS